MIDFTKLGSKSTQPPSTDPRSIFQTLPKLQPEKYQYPRDVQAEVWNQWHDRRNESDLVLKMNTGGGKTTVGLCILQSCLNEGEGPAVYVAPNDLLVRQVIAEARELGIKVTDDPKRREYMSGEAILVCNVYKIVNGRSVFGVNHKKIDIGSIIFDDAHACLNTINEQFSIKIPSNSDCYSGLFNLFSESIRQQSAAQHFSVSNGDPLASQKVPYWSWQQSIGDIHAILGRSQEEEFLVWPYPLLREHLLLCDCIVSSKEIEISTSIIPIDVIPSISQATRRIFMTATLSDDSILSSHFGVSSTELGRPITPSKAGDIGERMILAPQEINIELTEVDVRCMCRELSREQNVVVIAPSSKKAALWEEYADRILTSENIEEGIQELHSNPKAGLTVLVNRYDGIDLPGDACRVLVIDGMPVYKSLADRAAEIELSDSSLGHRDLIHKVEQGMGRGVRSNTDYCVVLLMGTDLISTLYLKHATNFFSPGTKAQLELSHKLTSELRKGNQTAQDILNTMDACLKRDQGWVSVALNELAGLTFGNQSTDPVIPTIREAYNLYFTVMDDSILKINNLDRIDGIDDAYRGYLKQIIGKYVNRLDPERAQKIQKSAIRINSKLLKPIQGVERKPSNRSAMDQAINTQKYLSSKYNNGNEIVLAVNSLVADLTFVELGSKKFEKALSDAGKLIGLMSQQPDTETSTGPDVFWYLGPEWGFVFECKSEATTTTISKGYCGQLGMHVNWHLTSHPMCKPPVPVMVHPASDIKDPTALPPDTKMFNSDSFEGFKTALHVYAAALAFGDKYLQASEIRPLLERFNFLPERFVKHYLRSLK